MLSITKCLTICFVTICLIVQFSVKPVNTKNILFLCGMPSPSHHIWNKSIMKALVERGHNVTMITVEQNDKSSENMHFIQMNGVYEALNKFFIEEYTKKAKTDMKIDLTRRTPIESIIETTTFFALLDEIMINTDGVKQLYNYPKKFKFDLIIHDYTSSPVLLGFVNHFDNPPLISVSAYNIPPHTNSVSGVVNFPSYLPFLGVEMINKMSYTERVKNLYYWLFDYFYREFIFMPKENEMARSVFGSDLPSLQSIERNTELVLVNIDFCIDYAQLLPPNVIPVGGLQVKKPQPLENELDDFINNSKNGVILFSLGTNIKSSYLGSTINTFLETFRQLKDYNFIWKFETDGIENIPENVLIREFLPQTSILAHPNIKLFMTHGGLLSMQESIWNGVPMLGFPVFVDQPQNMLKVKESGLGLELNIQNLTVQLLVKNIRTIIEDPSYKENAIKKSKIFRNQPMHPLDRATFWIEHVLENNGAEHLKLGNSHLNIFQLYMLDIFGVIFFIAVQFIMIFVKYCCCRRGKQSAASELNASKKKN